MPENQPPGLNEITAFNPGTNTVLNGLKTTTFSVNHIRLPQRQSVVKKNSVDSMQEMSYVCLPFKNHTPPPPHDKTKLN